MVNARIFAVVVLAVGLATGDLALFSTHGARAGDAGPTAPLRQLPQSRDQIVLSFAPVVRKVAPAVVNIYSRKVELARGRSPLFDDPFFRRFFGEEFGLGGPVRKQVRTALGSGVIVDPGGIIVTNVHVIQGASEIRVVLSDRHEFDAEVVLTDERTDLAVLRIKNGQPLPYVPIRDSDTLQVGDLVLAIGNPFGVGQTVTSGIVSALARTTVGVTDFRFFIQTDAAINPGNSGGALVTMDGGLVGINTAIYSRSGGSIGIGFAVPSAMVKTVLSGVSLGRVVRPWFGATGRAIDAEIARELNIAPPRGVLIVEVHAAGPAAAAGLRPGDVVTAINGRKVNDPEALRFRFATLAVGGEARLDVLRRGEKRRVSVALQPPPEVPPRDVTTIEGANPLNGAQVANLSPAVADELSMDEGLSGVVILDLASGSFARRAGLAPKDIVRAVNGAEVASVDALSSLLQRLEGTARWSLTLERGGQPLTLAVGG